MKHWRRERCAASELNEDVPKAMPYGGSSDISMFGYLYQ